jgi:hypothetical protein
MFLEEVEVSALHAKPATTLGRKSDAAWHASAIS